MRFPFFEVPRFVNSPFHPRIRDTSPPMPLLGDIYKLVTFSHHSSFPPCPFPHPLLPVLVRVGLSLSPPPPIPPRGPPPQTRRLLFHSATSPPGSPLRFFSLTVPSLFLPQTVRPPPTYPQDIFLSQIKNNFKVSTPPLSFFMNYFARVTHLSVS